MTKRIPPEEHISVSAPVRVRRLDMKKNEPRVKEAPSPVVFHTVLAKAKRLTKKQMVQQAMPMVQQQLLRLLNAWQNEDDTLVQVSEREVKVLTHLIGVIEKLIILDDRSRVVNTPTVSSMQSQGNEVIFDYEPIRIALEARISRIHNAATATGIS